MNIAIIGNPKTNSSTIKSLAERLTASGNTLKYPIEDAPSNGVDSEIIEIFEHIDWADMVIAIPREALAFNHDTTAGLAYAKYKKKTAFIYYG